MTRIASIAGVAAVATIILLSGCQTAVRVDLAKRLVGDWTTTEEIAGKLDLSDLGIPTPIDATVTVRAIVEDGPRHHRGNITITITTTPTDPMALAALMASTQRSEVVTTAIGTIYVRTTTDMQVEIASIANTPDTFAVPEDLTIQLEGVPLPATYELTDDVLMVTSDVLTFLGVVAQPLTLMR